MENLLRADSDIVSLILAIITIAAGVYSSFGSKKKKKEEKEENVFDFADDITADHSTEDEEIDMFDFNPGERICSVGEDKEDEEGLPSTAGMAEELPVYDMCADNEEREDAVHRLRERIKDSPKELVLFSELLKPKFKE